MSVHEFAEQRSAGPRVGRLLTWLGGGALLLRLLAIGFFVLVYLLPLVLRLWRGETTHDRQATACANRERAELEAETAIAIKRAEVRREAEIMWAEHQLTQARLAIEAQVEIDREQQRRRVLEACEAPMRASSRRTFEAVEEDMYLPIAAEAEPACGANAQAEVSDDPESLPARLQPAGEVAPPHQRGMPVIPLIPRAAARWIRPLVPPFVARVIDTTTQPLRTARQVFEEVEEITFTLKRTHRVTVDSETFDTGDQLARGSTTAEAPTHTLAGSVRRDRGHETDHDCDDRVGNHQQSPPLRRAAATDVGGLAPGSTPRELEPPTGPRQLPPSK